MKEQSLAICESCDNRFPMGGLQIVRWGVIGVKRLYCHACAKEHYRREAALEELSPPPRYIESEDEDGI